MASEIKERANFLEESLNRFIINVDKSSYRLNQELQRLSREVEKTSQVVQSLSVEMKAFKEEMQADREQYREEMQADREQYRDEMQADRKRYRDEMQANRERYRKENQIERAQYRKEMQIERAQYREEMRIDLAAFKEEMRQSRRELNKKWGELANKLGTFAEDIAAPNLPRIAREQFNEANHIFFATNLYKSAPGKKEVIYEFDAILETENALFFLESKYTVRGKYINGLPTIIDNFKTCFPEYADKEFIPIFASMKLHANTLKKLTRMNIYAMAMGDRTMELFNFDDLQKKRTPSKP
ncbi:MAG: hypothetical protein AAF960_07005 [Bacteroidota bacterium]